MNNSFQEPLSSLMQQLIFFHDHAMFILVLIVFMLMVKSVYLMSNKFTINNALDGQALEIIWTLLPTFVVVTLAAPSLQLLYLLDEVNAAALTLKAVGHQWYWSYEYSNYLNTDIQMSFDSYMIPAEFLSPGQFRLLEVDNRLVLPYGVNISVLVTSADVLHSWAVPSLGVKADAAPGRLSELSFLILRSGMFFGQCSEICGANHSFMPVSIESLDISTFSKFVM